MHNTQRFRTASDYRHRILISIGLFYAAAFTLASLAGWHYASTELYNSLTRHLLETSRTQALAIDSYIERVKSIARSYARVIEHTVPADDQITPAMLGAFREEAGLSDLYFGSADGQLVTDLHWEPPSGYNPRSRPWYLSALQNTSDPVYSGVYQDLIFNELAISYSARVSYPDGTLRGVLAADILLKTLQENFNLEGDCASEKICLIDKNGFILMNPDANLRGIRLIDVPGEQSAALQQLIGTERVIDYHDKNGLLGIATLLPKTGWTLGLIVEKKTVLLPLYRLGWFFLLMMTASLSLVIAVSRNLAKKLSRFAEQLENELGVKNVELQEKIREIERISVTDPLTGIANRRKIEDRIAKEVQRVQRTGNSCSLILFDVDLFKHINDQYGHKQGDEVLQRLTALVSRTIRQTDTLGRWGGEEFLVLCPDTTVQGTVQLAEKIRAAVEKEMVYPEYTITCSFGVSTSRPDDTAARLVCRADTAMYKAKRAGRNRIELEEVDPVF